MGYPWRKWMYHKEQKAAIFMLYTEEEYQEKLAEGWRDSPADLDKVQVKAKNDKPRATAKPKPSAPNPEDYDIGSLMESFNSDPESLEHDALLVLAKTVKAKVLPNWKKPTLISKIQEKLNGSDH